MKKEISAKDVEFVISGTSGQERVIEGFADVVSEAGLGYIYGVVRGSEESEEDYIARIIATKNS